MVRQLEGNKFAGIQMLFNFTSIGNEERLNIKNDKWLLRAYFGIRL